MDESPRFRDDQLTASRARYSANVVTSPPPSAPPAGPHTDRRSAPRQRPCRCRRGARSSRRRCRRGLPARRGSRTGAESASRAAPVAARGRARCRRVGGGLRRSGSRGTVLPASLADDRHALVILNVVPVPLGLAHVVAGIPCERLVRLLFDVLGARLVVQAVCLGLLCGASVGLVFGVEQVFGLRTPAGTIYEVLGNAVLAVLTGSGFGDVYAADGDLLGLGDGLVLVDVTLGIVVALAAVVARQLHLVTVAEDELHFAVPVADRARYLDVGQPLIDRPPGAVAYFELVSHPTSLPHDSQYRTFRSKSCR